MDSIPLNQTRLHSDTEDMFNSRVNRAIVAFITLQGDQGRFQQHRSKTCHHMY